MSTRADADSALFSVEDTGAGISRADLPRLFDKFFTIKASTSAAGLRDQGLGLAIVKSIAERHNGRVWVESQLGKGSTFYFRCRKQPDSSPNFGARRQARCRLVGYNCRTLLQKA